MQCPYCNYEDGWNGEKMEDVKGEHGAFFMPSNGVLMRRNNETMGYNDEARGVAGCPACNKIFMAE